jgi:hypothetical protein
MLLDNQHINVEHKYKLSMHHNPPTNPVWDGIKWIVEKLITTVDVTYTNNVGPEWAFTNSYEIMGVELKASIGGNASVEGLVGDAAKEKAKSGITGFLSEAWEQAKKVVSEELEPEWEKPENEKESPKLIEGGLDVGVLTLELEEEVEAEDPSEYWAPNNIAGPIVVAQFCNLESAVNGTQVKYTGIDSLEFTDGGAMIGRLIFPKIGAASSKQGLGMGFKIEFTPVAMAAGYAQKVSGGG